jgi:hypothetical protein
LKAINGAPREAGVPEATREIDFPLLIIIRPIFYKEKKGEKTNS